MGRFSSFGFSRARGFAAAAVLAVAIAVPWASTGEPGSAVAATRPGDELLIVDCLLPGKLRKLGKRLTFVSARRAVRTTASDCEIRGGEYTAYDRANYGTALKIWLPLAKDGDPEAQTNLGEIYEKGLGVPPQHDIAAEWYRRAAEQGLARAQINLGQLYEQGLGVPKDMVKAVEWYRRASGLGESKLAYVPADVSDELEELRAERESLRGEREALARERDALREQLEKVRRELDDAKRRLERRSGEVGSTLRQLEAARTELERQRRAASQAGDKVKVRELESALAGKSTEVDRHRAELDRMRTRVAELDGRAGRLQQALATSEARRAREAEHYRADAEAARLALAGANDRLNEAEAQLARQRAGDDDTRAQIARLQASLEGERSSARRSESRVRELKGQLDGSKRELAAQGGRIAELGGQIEALRDQAAKLRGRAQEVERYRADAENARTALASVSERLSNADAQLARQQADDDETRARIAELQTALENERSLAQRDEAKIRRFEAQLGSRKSELAAQGDRIAELGGQIESLHGKAAELRERAREVERFRADAEAARLALTRVSERLKGTETQLERQRAGDDEARARIAKFQAALERERSSARRDEAKIAELEGQLDGRKNELAAQGKRIAELGGQIETLQNEAAELRERAKAEAARPAETKVASAGPSIELIEPPIGPMRAAATPTFDVGASQERIIVGKVNAAAGLITLIVNDEEQKTSGDGIFRAAVKIRSAETPVRIVAVDAGGQRASLEFVFLSDLPVRGESVDGQRRKDLAADIQFGAFHALVIGSNSYANLPDLKTAVADAEDVGAILESRYGFQTTVLLNADRYAILSALNAYREKLTEDDNLLIYYAGHGELDRINNRGHWLPVDAEPNSTANWISNIQITDVLNAMSVRQLMVVADSCYSGTMTRAALAKIDSGMSDQARRTWIKLMAGKRARVVLSSGGVQPVLDDDGGRHSVFARAFLEVLEENDDILEGQGLYQAVSRRVASSAAAQKFDQVPQYAPIKYAGHEAGDFFFVPIVR